MSYFENRDKQEYVSEWQKKFNSIEFDLRFDNEVQVEWHQRLVDLIDQGRFQKHAFSLIGQTIWKASHSYMIL